MHKIGRYVVERELGRGEMGIVYLATDPVLDRRVALKTVRIPDGLDTTERDEYLKRFYREAQAAGKLSHPGIVTIYDAGQDESTQGHFMAMEYIAGVTLKQLFADGPRLAPRQAAFIVANVAEALDYAHAHGVVHRDVKPANIILTDRGAVKLADFGIAKIPSSHLTMEGTYLGTPAYTSPEQVLGRPVNGRSDLFSLGIVLYELLSGRKPFPAENLGQLFHAIAYEPHQPLGEVLPRCPPELAAVVDRTLGKEEGNRYASGRDMACDLRTFLGEKSFSGQDLAGPFGPAHPPALEEPGATGENPLADLVDYIEETTRRLAPKDAPPAGPTHPASSLSRTGIRPRLLRALAAGSGGAWLARELPARTFWILAAGSALAAALIFGALLGQARRQFPPGAPSPTTAIVPSWRADFRAGRTDLDAGRIEEALARFQRLRLQRPQSPALASLVKAAMARFQETLQTDLGPSGQAGRLQELGEAASMRGDAASAADYFQAALRVEPQNTAAAAALQALASQPQAASAPVPGPSLRLVFDSPVRSGYIVANVDGTQVLRKEFAFEGGNDSKSSVLGRLEEPLTASEGRHRIQVWITIKNKESYTAYGAIEGRIKTGGSSVLSIRLDSASKKLVLSLDS